MIIGVLGGLALLMWPMTNTIYFILLIAYLLSIVMMYGVFRLKGSVYYLILQVFLKAFVLTVLSAFMQVNFISIQLLIEAVPILLSTLFYFSELETLDNIKYGTSLKSSYLKYATLSGVFGLIISVIVIKSAALSNLIPVILLGIVVLVTFFRIIKNNRFIAVDKSKNITAFLYAIMLLIYSLI